MDSRLKKTLNAGGRESRTFTNRHHVGEPVVVVVWPKVCNR